MQGSGTYATRRVAACLAAGLLSLATVTLPAGAASAAESREVTSPYLTELLNAESRCLDRYGWPVPAETLQRCVGDLAAPDPRSAVQMDLFRMFSNCLYIAEQQALDQAAPPTTKDYENYVNECMGL